MQPRACQGFPAGRRCRADTLAPTMPDLALTPPRITPPGRPAAPVAPAEPATPVGHEPVPILAPAHELPRMPRVRPALRFVGPAGAGARHAPPVRTAGTQPGVLDDLLARPGPPYGAAWRFFPPLALEDGVTLRDRAAALY